jgi:hypothetical protein
MIGTPFFVVFGWLSDKIGRKPIVLAGCLLAALTYFPIFRALTHAANPALEAAVKPPAPVTVIADPADCSFQFDPVGRKRLHQLLRRRQERPWHAPACPMRTQRRRRQRRHGAHRRSRRSAPSKARADDNAEAARRVHRRLQAALGAAGYPAEG